MLEGNWTALMKGRGMEFAGFRKYTYGDDASRIDWGASLRAKETLIREFEEYRNVNIIFMLDVSNTMLFTSQKKLKAEYAAELVFQLAVATLDGGDSVGHVLFTDKVVSKGMPGIGKQAIYELAAALMNPKNYGGNKDLRPVMLAVNAMLKQRALIVFVSDFIAMPEGWERYIRMLSEKFDLMAIMIRDPHDEELPHLGGQFLLEDPFTQERLYVDTNDYERAYGKLMLEEDARTRAVFRSAHAGLVEVRTDQDLIAPVLAYLRRRNKLIKD
jgi:uncharacterized protein (DUF58 family)